jgi:hypothetical protein
MLFSYQIWKKMIWELKELKKTKRNKIVLYIYFYYSFLLTFSEVLIVLIHGSMGTEPYYRFFDNFIDVIFCFIFILLKSVTNWIV